MYKPFEEFRITAKCVSVIGSGGKTAFLHYLSEHLPGTVILTTSTHIRPFLDIPLVDAAGASREQVRDGLRSALSRSRVVCLGRSEPSGKLADPSGVFPFEDLLAEADYILVEADGAAGRPLKAHRPHEPVIPSCSGLTVCLAGASGIGRPVSEVCHCPELFASLAGISPDNTADRRETVIKKNDQKINSGIDKIGAFLNSTTDYMTEDFEMKLRKRINLL